MRAEMPEWAIELGVPENGIVVDLGVCPWCGGYELHVASNGRAAGRRPGTRCCLRGALAEAARIREILAQTRNPQEQDEKKRELRDVMGVIQRIGASPEELSRAAQDVIGQYRLDPRPILHALERLR